MTKRDDADNPARWYTFNMFASADCKKAVQALIEAGYRRIGEDSAFGVVLAHSHMPDRVVKIAHRPKDDGWLPFIDHARNCPSEHLPTVYDYEEHETYAVAVLETLEPLDWRTNPGPSDTFNSASAAGERRPEVWEQYKRVLPPELGDVLQGLRDCFLEEWHFDLHAGNFMLRGDTLVVTDPLSYRRGQ